MEVKGSWVVVGQWMPWGRLRIANSPSLSPHPKRIALRGIARRGLAQGEGQRQWWPQCTAAGLRYSRGSSGPVVWIAFLINFSSFSTPLSPDFSILRNIRLIPQIPIEVCQSPQYYYLHPPSLSSSTTSSHVPTLEYVSSLGAIIILLPNVLLVATDDPL